MPLEHHRTQRLRNYQTRGYTYACANWKHARADIQPMHRPGLLARIFGRK